MLSCRYCFDAHFIAALFADVYVDAIRATDALRRLCLMPRRAALLITRADAFAYYVTLLMLYYPRI